MPSILKNIQGTKSNLILYADDSNLITTSKTYKDLEITCNEQLKVIDSFFMNNSLFLNAKKTNKMVFSTKQSNKSIPEISISVGENKIESVKLTKFLGVTIDSNLSWDCHVQKLSHKISSGIYCLRQMSRLCSFDVLKSIYFAHIHSHITYGLAVYGGTTKTNLDIILTLQKKAIRIMLNLEDDNISVKEKFSQLGILTIYDQYIFECIMLIRVQFDRLDLRRSVHSHLTRHRNDIDLAQHNLGFYTKKATHMGSKFINHLPNSLKIKINENSFRNLLKTYLMEKSCYSLNEFYST